MGLMMTEVAPATPTQPAAGLEELFSELANGELDALEPIYDLCADDLFGLALWRCGSRAEAEDAVQEAFVRLATTSADLRKVRDPRAYLLTVVRRAACDQVRRRPVSTHAFEDLPAQGLFLEDPSSRTSTAADAVEASRALGRLPAAQREAVYLHHFLGLTFAEIGKVMRVPTFTAASRHRKGLEKLRRYLGASP